MSYSNNPFKKAIWTICIIAVLVLAGWGYFKFYFAFGEGVKAGELNQLMYKGWVWKTYEGRLIQAGFKGAKGGGNIQSNEFNFSITDKAVADSLMKCSGKIVELHYTEYKGALPWRGMQKYIVDGVIAVREQEHVNSTIPIVTDGE